MEDYNNNGKNSRLKQVFIIGLVFLAGFYFGAGSEPEISKVKGVAGKENPEEIKADFSVFWDVWNIVEEKYVPPDPEANGVTSAQDRVWGAISGMVDSLEDPNTIFLLPSESEIFEREISGNFDGIGMEVGVKEGMLVVIAPLKGTPAYKAGIKPGDKIFKIDEKETISMSADEAVRLIRGKKGTKVSLTLFREGRKEPIEVTIVRDTIDIPTIDTEWQGDIFVIKLYNFSASSADLFRISLREFIANKNRPKKMILDLRENPGGLLGASVDIASWFLPAGKVIVREDFGPSTKEIVYRSKGYNVFDKDFKLVILVDGGSASASEILAGALREHEIATLVGSQTFGKGSVQELIKTPQGTSLKITIARWLTPEGKSISLEGLVPDVSVELTEEDIEANRDPVMGKAIEILNK